MAARRAPVATPHQRWRGDSNFPGNRVPRRLKGEVGLRLREVPLNERRLEAVSRVPQYWCSVHSDCLLYSH